MCNVGLGMTTGMDAHANQYAGDARRAASGAGRRILRWAVGAIVTFGLLVTVATTQPSVEQSLAAASQAKASLRYDRALDWYARAESTAPDDPRAFCDSAAVLALQQEWTASSAEYAFCLRIKPSDGAAWLSYGDVLSRQGNAEAAQNAWSRATAAGDARGLRQSALAYESTGHLNDATTAWTRLPANDAEAQFHLGMLALSTGADANAARYLGAAMTSETYRRELGEQGFTPFLKSPPHDAQSLALLGYTFLGAGMPWLALAPLHAAVALAPEDGKAHAILGWALWLTGAHQTARDEIALGQRLAPKYSFAQYAAAQVAAADGNFALALDLSQKALALDDSSPATWMTASQVEVALRDYVGADLAATNAAALTNDPNYTIALLQLYADHRLGLDNGRAQRAATLAVQRFPNNEPIRYLAGLLFDLMGQPTLSYYALQAAISLDPTDPAPYVLLAHYADSEGSFVTAALYLRTALALRPHGPEAADAWALLTSLDGFTV